MRLEDAAAGNVGREYDALLVVSFGGPEKMEDVIPFLERTVRGRSVPRERILGVAEHYYQFGGSSPINRQNRALIRALEAELAAKGPALPIYWGNRNWHPLLPDTIRAMKADGIQRALAYVTSAYSSYSSCRLYLENIESARREAGAGAPAIDKLRAFYNHPQFIRVWADRVREALEQFPPEKREAARLIFTAHSIPSSMADECAYVQQLEETCRLVSESLGRPPGDLVYQSRSGSPSQPWLGPDILGYLRRFATKGKDVVIAPVGFVSDHMEIAYDLDTEAQNLCNEIGLNMVRAATPGTHPEFVGMIRELILERMVAGTGRRALGNLGPHHDACPSDCCLRPLR